MIKLLRLAFLLGIGLLGTQCTKEAAAPKPTYLKLDAITLKTNYEVEGTAHSNITTAWVFIDNDFLGAYELPCVVPAILSPGEHVFTINPGINVNGISSLRAINESLSPIIIKDTINQTNTLDTLIFTPQQLQTSYRPQGYNIIIAEDFDQSGINFSTTLFSDTTFTKVDNTDSTFNFTLPINGTAEENGDAGLIVLTDERNTVELISVNSYNISPGTENVYLEVSYRTNMQVSFGLQADYNNFSNRDLTATVLPKKEWSKIYINLITEFDAFPNANGYRLLIFARKPSTVKEGRIFLDNLKLVYEE
jgi:hypothetical protein